MDDRQRLLISEARKAAEAAHAPYSGQPRGAALECVDGTIFAGAATEFAAYGSTVCAEIAALTAAVTAGQRQFKRLAVVPCRLPCGNCRQCLREFGISLEVITEKDGGELLATTLERLLPNSFGPESLG